MVEFEKQKLMDCGRTDLTSRVRRVSVVEGDGLGYDILSYDENGNELYIEVKTTTGSFSQPFYMSANELECSRRDSVKYRLYRVYQFDPKQNSASVAVFSGSLEKWCTSPASYRINLV